MLLIMSDLAPVNDDNGNISNDGNILREAVKDDMVNDGNILREAVNDNIGNIYYHGNIFREAVNDNIGNIYNNGKNPQGGS